MIIYYSKKPIEELSINSNNTDFLIFAKKLFQGGSVSLDIKGIKPNPYERVLHKSQIKVIPQGLVNLQVFGNDLIIIGDKKNLSQFSEEISHFAQDQSLGKHLHIEYFENHDYLHPEAVPLVIERL